jgi:hypothetical protein
VTDILSDEFAAQAAAAGNRARLDLLARGIPVFYRDPITKVELMEMPDGRRFEIRYIPNAPAERNYEVIRQIAAPAA